jgi:hypothetical protein
MPMLEQLLLGAVLIAITVAIHGAVMGWLTWRLGRRHSASPSLWSHYALLAKVALWCVIAHLVEIAAWAAVYWWAAVHPNFELALYFSAVTYATIGYGDVVPPESWRLLSSMEGLIGILMCAWSGGFIFAVVTRLHQDAAAARRPA